MGDYTRIDDPGEIFRTEGFDEKIVEPSVGTRPVVKGARARHIALCQYPFLLACGNRAAGADANPDLAPQPNRGHIGWVNLDDCHRHSLEGYFFDSHVG